MGYAVTAYVLWGVLPLFWKHLQEVSGSHILAHRIVWSIPCFLFLLYLKVGKKTFAHLTSARPYLWSLGLSATLVSSNWFLYLLAVNTGRVLEASLGYFMSPIVSVILGTVFLKEKLSKIQKIALVLVILGVFQLSLLGTEFPLIAFGLALTFSSYGLIRKTIPVEPLVASTLETLLIAVPAFFFFIYLYGIQGFEVPHGTQMGLLAMSGAVTAIPLVFFTQAVKRLPLTTIGFIQYVCPSIQFLLAVYFYSEPFTAVHARGFMCIWAALALYSFELAAKMAKSSYRNQNNLRPRPV